MEIKKDVSLLVRIDKAMHHEFKLICLQQGISMQAAINLYIRGVVSGVKLGTPY